MNNNISQMLANASNLLKDHKFQEANNIYQNLILQFPESHEVYHAFGVALINQNQPKLAIEKFLQSVRLDPKNANYHSDLGEMYRRIGMLDQSIKFNLESVSLNPNSDSSHNNLGLAYFDKQDFNKAIVHLEKTIEINPKHGFALNNLGSAFFKLGKMKQSSEAYQKAVDLNPNHLEALYNLGGALVKLNKIDEAINMYNKAINISPYFFQAHCELAYLKKFTKDDPHLQLLKELPIKNQLNPKDLTKYHFAYGKALDDIGEYDDAFYHYELANKKVNQLIPKNKTDALESINRINNLYSVNYINKLKSKNSSNNLNRTPIFVVGMPRSGTTLIEQILDMNRNIYGAGELTIFFDCIRKNIINDNLQSPKFEGSLEGLYTPKESFIYENFANDYLNKLWELSPKSNFIIDKSPGNFNHLGMIYLAMPNAKIIHAVRDPMESCFSNFTKFFTDYDKHDYSLESLGTYYKGYHLLMEHWKTVLPKDFICHVKYEDMVNNMEKESRRMTDFIGVEWDPSSLKFYENKRTVETPSKMQVNKPIYKTSIARWKKFAKHLKPLYEIVKPYRAYDPEMDEMFNNIK
jgi:tetratricopeptide (TPR) repeat protein